MVYKTIGSAVTEAIAEALLLDSHQQRLCHIGYSRGSATEAIAEALPQRL